MSTRAWIAGVFGVGLAACVASGACGPRSRALILVELAGPGVRDGVVRGVVREMTTNKPLAGRWVVVVCPCLPEAHIDITDAMGVYAIDGLPAGEYTLIVGYHQAKFRFVLPPGARARADAYIDTRALRR